MDLLQDNMSLLDPPNNDTPCVMVSGHLYLSKDANGTFMCYFIDNYYWDVFVCLW